MPGSGRMISFFGVAEFVLRTVSTFGFGSSVSGRIPVAFRTTLHRPRNNFPNSGLDVLIDEKSVSFSGRRCFMALTIFSEETEQDMRTFYRTLNERDRRRYAGLEAKKLGHGGISYISEVLGCDRKTVSKGIDEILDPPDLDPARVRQKGGTAKLS